MSINWVMLSERDGFSSLPGEQRLYTSPPRTSLSCQTLNKFPGKQPWAVQSSSGTIHLTNRRIVYLPSSPSTQLQSFAAPLLNLHDTHVTAPWFGPNVWTAVVQPVPGGGIPPEHAALELKITFKEGGAFDYHTNFERVKERLSHAVQLARENGQANDSSDTGGRGGGGDVRGVNMDSVTLEDLPAYSATGQSVPVQSVPVQSMPAPAQAAPSTSFAATPMHSAMAGLTGNAHGASQAPPVSNATGSSNQPPDEPPPGYEEAMK